MHHLRGLDLLLESVIELVDDAAHQQLGQLPPELLLVLYCELLPVSNVVLYLALHLLLLQEPQAQLGQSSSDLLVLPIHLSQEVLPRQTAHKGLLFADVNLAMLAIGGLGRG